MSRIARTVRVEGVDLMPRTKREHRIFKVMHKRAYDDGYRCGARQVAFELGRRGHYALRKELLAWIDENE